MTIPTWAAVVIVVVLMSGTFGYGAVAYRKQHGKWPW